MTPHFILRGTVSGLSGTLVLLNNGADELTLSSDGPFQFFSSVPEGSDYNVTVKTQPSTQDCGVQNGSGKIDGADVSKVSVLCTDLSNALLSISDGPEYNFGSAILGSVRTKTFTITNSEKSLPAANFSATVSTGAYFSFEGGAFPGTGGTCVSGGSIQAGDSCTVVVSFAPAVEGNWGAYLTVTYNDGAGDQMTKRYMYGAGAVCDPSATPFGGGDGALKPYLICAVAHLQNVRGNETKIFILMSDLDLQGVSFLPIGDFSGLFLGNQLVISHFTLTGSSENYVGLFKRILAGGEVNELRLTDVALQAAGRVYVGGLAGANYGSIWNTYATGSVTGQDFVGGLVGQNSGLLMNTSAGNSVTGNQNVGGLAGENSGSITRSYASGSVAGVYSVGGLVGRNGGSIEDSYATGPVTGTFYPGGLVGQSYASTIRNTYAVGTVTGDYAGGLVAYSVDSLIEHSFWDTETSGQLASAGGEGKTTAQMKSKSTYVDPDGLWSWDFISTWWISYKFPTAYPVLRWQRF